MVTRADTGQAAANYWKSELINLLTTTTKPLIGQNLGHADVANVGFYRYFVNAAPNQSGRVPIIMGLDYGYDDISASAITGGNLYLKDHHQRGGWCTVSMHPRNPSTNLTVSSKENTNIPDILTSGTVANGRWMAVLALVGDGLLDLQNAGIPVLFRPLHEMNGDFFWWGNKVTGTWTTPLDYKNLWLSVYNYMTVTRGLTNILWVYGPNAQFYTDSAQSTMYYYPGSAYVDVVSMDAYTTDLTTLNANNSYTDLVASGKPFGFAEISTYDNILHPLDAEDVLNNVLIYCPQSKFINAWHSWGNIVYGVDIDNFYASAVDKDWTDNLPYEKLASITRDYSYTGPTRTLGTQTLSGNRGWAKTTTNLREYLDKQQVNGSTVPVHYPYEFSVKTLSDGFQIDFRKYANPIREHRVYINDYYVLRPEIVHHTCKVGPLRTGRTYQVKLCCVDSNNIQSGFSKTFSVTL